jgi:pyridoxamine 5'-phosphate oxidase
MTDISSNRREYLSRKLSKKDLEQDPFRQFKKWLEEAYNKKLTDVNAMTLATCSAKSKPSARIVLLRHWDERGFVFFTNYESKKGFQIAENPWGALVFYWYPLERQIRIEGKIVKTSHEESDGYFDSRPEGSQVGAWASPQSKKIPNREYLESLQEDYIKIFKNSQLKRPISWGGYRLIPDLFEFWQGRENRLHDRFEYTCEYGPWDINRLAP